MTELLRELEAVVGLSDRADQGCWRIWANELRSGPHGDANFDHSHLIAEFSGARTHNLQFVQALVLLYRTHHAEIAEALKDARRYRWPRDRLAGAAHVRELVEYNHDMHPKLRGEVDAAIDAHNSAREVGE